MIDICKEYYIAEIVQSRSCFSQFLTNLKEKTLIETFFFFKASSASRETPRTYSRIPRVIIKIFQDVSISLLDENSAYVLADNREKLIYYRRSNTHTH